MAESAKSNKALYIIIGVAVLVVGAVVIYFLTKGGPACDPLKNGFDVKGNPNPKCQFNNPATSNEPAPQGTPGWVSDATFPIKKGSWGPKVAALQKAIGADDDGKFGSDTEKKLIAKTGNAEVSTQAEYDKIVNPVKTPVGGNNFDKVKTGLGASAQSTSDGNGIYTVTNGENAQYSVYFYNNSRVSFNRGNESWRGVYKDGGKEISIDSKDGGYKTGTFISNSKVQESIKSIIEQIEK